jgi:hypothetical protein
LLSCLALGHLLLHDLQRRQRLSEHLREANRMRRLRQRGRNRLLAGLHDLLHQLLLGVVRTLHRPCKSHGRTADGLAQPCKHARQAFGLAAAARSELCALGKRCGKAHLEARTGPIIGQMRRWTEAAAVMRISAVLGIYQGLWKALGGDRWPSAREIVNAAYWDSGGEERCEKLAEDS